jgi:cytoskeletal protein RodZ
MGITESSRPDFGMKMRRQREERGITLRQIADATKIGLGSLEALERNDISRLPGGIFSRAFVRSYAVEVGLDPEQTVREFIDQFPHDSVTAGSPHVLRDDRRDRDAKGGGMTMKLAAVVAISVIIGVILFFTLANRP